ncbi:MAG: AAA family ATPase, partial [Flavobacteriales bacterium]|nr:AAA family ATPase [Flavobacteriales bacterium]
IGGFLIETGNFIEFGHLIISDEIFTDPKFRTLFNLFKTMTEKGIVIELVSVAQELGSLNKLKEISPVFLSNLTSNITNASPQLESWIRYLQQIQIKREINIAGKFLETESLKPDVDSIKLFGTVSDLIQKLNDSVFGKRIHLMKDHISSYIDGIQNAFLNKDSIRYIKSGIDDLDDHITGFEPGTLTILGARPGMGKSALATQIALNAVKSGKPTVLFSLEMSGDEIMGRIVSSISGIPKNIAESGRISKEQLDEVKKAAESLADLPFYIADESALDVQELFSECRFFKVQNKIELIIVDYLQLLKSGNSKSSIYEDVTEVSRKLKQIAKALNVPVIALSQLSREVDKRADKCPVLSDLRESGSIEQDADKVIFLFRPEYYQQRETSDGHSTEGLAILSISKNRNGPLKENIYLKFIPELTEFRNYESRKLRAA